MDWRSTQITRLPTSVQDVLGPNLTFSSLNQVFFCGFYHQGPANLGENKKFLNTDLMYLLHERKLFSLQLSSISCA